MMPVGSRERSLYHQVTLDPCVKWVKVNQEGVKGTLFIPPGEMRLWVQEGQGQLGQDQGMLFILPGEIKDRHRGWDVIGLIEYTFCSP